MATNGRRSTVPIPHHGATRRGGLRSKTPSINELSKKMKNTPKGKRRLEFVEEPLKGKTFYLDLQGYKKVSSLAARIQELGGKVEEFLSKDINYLITNRKEADSRLSPRSNSTPSPGLSIPSPFPPTGNRSSSLKGAWPSPLSGGSPQSIETPQPAPKHDTRAKAMMKQAQATLTNRYGTSNTLTNARTWGVCVIYLEKALEKLAEYGPISHIDKQPSIKELMGYGKKQLRVKIRKLQVPFIKVEDQSRQYRPLVKEFKEWPFPDFDSPVGTCPFDTPRERRDHEPKKRNKEKAHQKDTKKDKTKQGYCECCCIHYDALDVHLKSDHHQSFAKNDTNYKNLDQLISQGPSLKVFLEKTKIKYSGNTTQTKQASCDEVSNPFQTPTKNKDRLYEKDGQQEVMPGDNTNNKDKEPIERENTDLKTLSEVRCGTPIEASRLPKPTTPTMSCETRRVTRSQSSPENKKVNELSIDLDTKLIKEVPHERSTVVAQPQQLSEPKSDPQHQIKQKIQQSSHASSSDSFNKQEKCDNKETLQTVEAAQPQMINDAVEKLDKHKEDENDGVHDTASAEPLFTRLRDQAKKSSQSDVDDFKPKRVLRSSSKTNSSDSTETLSNNEGVRPVSPRKRQDTDNLSSSTVSLPEKFSKSNVAESPIMRSAKNRKKTSPLENDSHTSVSEDKGHKNVTSHLSLAQLISSPKSGHTVDRINIDDSSGCEEVNLSMVAEPGTPKTASKSRETTQCKKNLNHPSGTQVRDSNVESNDTLHAVQEQKRPATVYDETFTSLFDSDDDDDEPFDGFDIPHFEGSRSSEHEYMYRIKEIINYYTSSQESTLVESGEEDEEDSPVKIKKQPHGIKIIISSRTDDVDDDVFEDNNSDDDDSDDDRSTIADSTDGNEDEHLLSSPLRMDTLFNKRKSWNLDDVDNERPPKRRRTITEDNDEDGAVEQSNDGLQSSSQNTVDGNDHNSQSSLDSKKQPKSRSSNDGLQSSSQDTVDGIDHNSLSSIDSKKQPKSRSSNDGLLSSSQDTVDGNDHNSLSTIDSKKQPKSRSTRNNKLSDDQDCATEEAESTRRVTRSQGLETTVRMESNEWKVVSSSDDHKTASTNAKNSKKTSSSSTKKKRESKTKKRTVDDSKLPSSEPSSHENNDLETDSSVAKESLPELLEPSLVPIDEHAKEIPPEFLAPSIIVTTIEERVKLRRLQNQEKGMEKSKKESHSKSNRKVQKTEISETTNHIKETKVRCASVTEVRKSSVSKRESPSDTIPSVNITSRLRSRNHDQVITTQDQPISKNTKVSSTPCQKKETKGSPPLVNPNKLHKPSWIFSPVKFTASTPHPRKKTRSKSSNSMNNHESLTRSELRTISRCLIAGDSYEFTEEDVYAFD